MKLEGDTLVLESESEYSSIMKLLDAPTVKQIIRLLVSSPRRLHVLEIARLIGKHKSTVSIYLNRMYRAGLIDYSLEYVHEGANILERYKFVELRARKIKYGEKIIRLYEI